MIWIRSRYAASSSSGRLASSTRPIDVAYAGKRVPTLIETVMIRGSRDPGDVDHVVAVQDTDRRRLVHLGDQPLQMRLGHLGQRLGWTGRRSRVPGREGVSENWPPVGAHVAEVGERQQEPPGRGPGQVADPGHLAERRVGCSASKARMTASPRSSDWT